MTPAAEFLILAHRGLTQVMILAEGARALGYAVRVVTSLPKHAAAQENIDNLVAAGHAVHQSPRQALLWDDVELALAASAAAGHAIVGCMTIWEGYRAMMARVNASVGANDLDVATVELVLDKLAVRSALFALGLTRVQAHRWTADDPPPAGAAFVKPRRGRGSLGAFRYDPNVTQARLDGIFAGTQGDADFIDLRPEFIVEGYIPGTECCFEVLADEGEVHVVAIHEKLDLTERDDTVLEDSAICPPPNLSADAVRASITYLQACFRALGLRTGCYHAEAKCDPATGNWDLIEINPRIGGSLIHESAKRFTGGLELTPYWQRTIVRRNDPQALRALSHRWTDGTAFTHGKSTFFRSFYGLAGRTIASIGPGECRLEPVVTNTFVQVGQTLPQSASEIMMANALWELPLPLTPQAAAELNTTSADLLRIVYAPVPADAASTPAVPGTR